MQPRGWKIHVDDMLQAVQYILQYTRDLDFEGFTTNSMALHAVLYNLAILGEAAGGVPPEVQTRYLDVPWTEARGMRNKVIHEYFGLSLAILWQTVTVDLPPLVPLLETVLED